MKAILKKSVEDWFWSGEEWDMLTLKPMSRALTKCYLPRWSPSPLKELLHKELRTFRQMYLSLKVDCEENSPVVKSISLQCDLLDDWERTYDDNKVDWAKVWECLTEYFLSIGYPCIRCTKDEDMVAFIEKLIEEVPLTKDYFEIVDENRVL